MKYIKIIALVLLLEIPLSCTKQEKDFKKDVVKIEIQDNDYNEYNYSHITGFMEVPSNTFENLYFQIENQLIIKFIEQI